MENVISRGVEQKNIIRRSLSFIIDKIVILIVFLIVYIYLIYFGSFLSLGSYYALLGEKPSSYNSYDKCLAMQDVYGAEIFLFDSKEWSQCYNEIESQPELIEPFEGMTRNRDLLIIGFLIIVIFNYYLLGEWLLRASLGKRLCGLVIVSENNSRMSQGKILERNLMLLLLMVLAVAMRFVFDSSYYLTVLLFWLFIDFTVFINGRSVIDIVTNTWTLKY